MNNRKINFRSRWLVDTPLENECVLVLRSRLIRTRVPAQSLPQSINGPAVLREMRKHGELAEPVDETFYRWSRRCPLDRYVVTLHRAQ